MSPSSPTATRVADRLGDRLPRELRLVEVATSGVDAGLLDVAELPDLRGASDREILDGIREVEALLRTRGAYGPPLVPACSPWCREHVEGLRPEEVIVHAATVSPYASVRQVQRVDGTDPVELAFHHPGSDEVALVLDDEATVFLGRLRVAVETARAAVGSDGQGTD